MPTSKEMTQLLSRAKHHKEKLKELAKQIEATPIYSNKFHSLVEQEERVYQKLRMLQNRIDDLGKRIVYGRRNKV